MDSRISQVSKVHNSLGDLIVNMPKVYPLGILIDVGEHVFRLEAGLLATDEARQFTVNEEDLSKYLSNKIFKCFDNLVVIIIWINIILKKIVRDFLYFYFWSEETRWMSCEGKRPSEEWWWDWCKSHIWPIYIKAIKK